MDDRRRTLAALTIIIGFLVLVAFIVGVLLNSKKVISPVPEDNAIKIIFISPTVVPVVSTAPTPTP
jgi:ABC-type sugar transport system permease subunit